MLGGGHYNQEANKILEQTPFAIGHICAKHCLPGLDGALLLQAMEKTLGGARLVILDWKGLGTEKGRIVGMLEMLGIPFERSKNLRKEKE
jgi:D-tyrosyl-tRNA(Tyr) deacylase